MFAQLWCEIMLRREARKEQKDLDGSVREMFYENCID
jgi:hypothetical protein